ncbi:rhamnogalacturonan endolyase [Thermoanaerobacterium sp. RBIITD]|nr:rhamnogalacturonan lyase [Thermoanaerobacterium sp. RBIITD]SNX53395.1 rhamnogalacturonan endolyase [Thermoanaerobacterium sp. RBIITD]
MFKRTFMLTMIILVFVLPTLSLGMVKQINSKEEITNNMVEMKRQMEYLDRGLIAVKVDNGVYLSWRLLGTEPDNISFNVYRNGKKVNHSPVIDSTNYLDHNGSLNSIYYVRAVVNGKEMKPSEKVKVLDKNYLSIPLKKPADGITPDGVSYTYSANDASVGDLDGDGQYEIILKWDPSNSKDNSQDGYTGDVYLDAYKLNGKFMWRIDLGRNIRAGAHYTQFLVYDFDGDGRAEIACKTADGTIDGTGNIIGDPNADYRNEKGRILSGPEYLTIFDGKTGKALATTDYDPPRGNVSDWGDNYGNRVDRFLAAVAYLDGRRPSLVMARGYYTRTVLVAYNWRDGKLTKLWRFDSNDPGNSKYAGQGNHNLSVADVDNDGKDEIIYGSCVIDDNGKGLYSTGLGHGDAMHVGDLDPSRQGLEVFQVHEVPSNDGIELHDAKTGEIIWGLPTTKDTGRGLSADIDPRYQGEEMWAAGPYGLYNCKGQKISDNKPSSVNFAVWWDGDLLRELLDSNRIDKWDYINNQTINLFIAEDCTSNNGTKATPCLQADILGDWREEVIWKTADSNELRIYTTTSITNHRIYTLMHDPVYRLGIAWQNVAYNQPPHTSFYLGEGMSTPPKPDIYLVSNRETK